MISVFITNYINYTSIQKIGANDFRNFFKH